MRKSIICASFILIYIFGFCSQAMGKKMDKEIQFNQIEVVNESHIDGKYMLPLSKAISAFLETQQNMQQFDVYLSDKDEDIVEIAFSPKPIPGKKSLRGSNENGRGMSYYINTHTGDIVKSQLAR